MKNGKYQKQDIVALRKSIKHWKKDNVGKEEPGDITTSAGACALCTIYSNFSVWINECGGCPIEHKTGVSGCGKTPYEKAERLLQQWIRKDEKPKGFEKAVAAEIAFLEELLKEAEEQFAKKKVKK